MVYNWLKNSPSALFPPTCVLCGAPGLRDMDLCPGCHADLPVNRHACVRCAKPLPAQAPSGSLCGACQRRPPPFDACFAPYLYDGVLPHLVTGLKFHDRMNLARLLGRLLLSALRRRETVAPPVLMPVPLHPVRLRERGFNRALEIAREPASALGMAIDRRSLTRVLATEPQTGLDASARRRNLRGAFAVGGALPGRRVAVLDDVVTTGSTVAELTRVLKLAGVERVEVWAVARTP